MNHPEYPNSNVPIFVLAGLIAALFLQFFFGGCARTPSLKPPGPILEKDYGIADVDRGRDGKTFADLAVSPKFPVVYFDLDSYDIRPADREALAAAAQGITATWVCYVEGHASTDGEADYNLSLGSRRAGTVGDFIQAFKGISVVETSYGEERPVPGPLELSRRVEVRCR